MSPSAVASGLPESLPIFSGVSSVSTRDAAGPGDWGATVFTAEEVDRVGEGGSGEMTMAEV